MKKIIIDDEEYEIHENFNESIPFRLWNLKRKKNYWVYDGVQRYAIHDFVGKKLFEIEKGKLLGTDPEKLVWFPSVGGYIP